MKWTMKNGQQIEVSNMTDAHAKNALNMVINNISAKDALDLLLRGIESLTNTVIAETEASTFDKIEQRLEEERWAEEYEEELEYYHHMYNTFGGDN